MCYKNVIDYKPRFFRLRFVALLAIIFFCIVGTRVLYAEVSQSLKKLGPEVNAISEQPKEITKTIPAREIPAKITKISSNDNPISEQPKEITKAIPASEIPVRITKISSNDIPAASEKAYRTFISRRRVGWGGHQDQVQYPRISAAAIKKTYNSTDQIQARLKEQAVWNIDWKKWHAISKKFEDLPLKRVEKAWYDYHLLALSKRNQKSIWSHVQSEGPTLVIFNYYENSLNHENAAFFFRHHNPDWADVLLIVNGDEHTLNLPPWVKVLIRKNIGLEYCAMMEILPLILYGKPLDGNEELLALWRKKYSYFMLLNASVRGPFYPLWQVEASNWVEVFKSQLTEDVWLVGTSFNCMKSIPSLYHLQSFTLMTHRRGMALIYMDFQQRLLILEASGQSCDVSEGFVELGKQSVVFVYEIGMTQTFLTRNIGVKSITLAWQDVDFRFSEGVNTLCLKQHDQYFPTQYFGITLNLFEVIFYKTNTASFKRVDMDALTLYTLWFDNRAHSLL